MTKHDKTKLFLKVSISFRIRAPRNPIQLATHNLQAVYSHFYWYISKHQHQKWHTLCVICFRWKTFLNLSGKCLRNSILLKHCTTKIRMLLILFYHNPIHKQAMFKCSVRGFYKHVTDFYDMCMVFMITEKISSQFLKLIKSAQAN